MFGHQDSMNPQQDNHAAAPEPQADSTLAHDVTAPAPVAPTTLPSPAVSVSPAATASNDDHVTATSAPTVGDDDDDDTAGSYIMTDPRPVTAAQASPVSSSQAVAPTAEPAADTDDLLELKQGALQQLAPLVDHLDQTPEEKFRTTMMMIQAADNQTLLKSAYETAQQITDEKAKAQALLDVVNEINYFTQQNNGDAEKSEDSDEPSL